MYPQPLGPGPPHPPLGGRRADRHLEPAVPVLETPPPAPPGRVGDRGERGSSARSHLHRRSGRGFGIAELHRLARTGSWLDRDLPASIKYLSGRFRHDRYFAARNHSESCRGDLPEQTRRDPGRYATTRPTLVRKIGRIGVFLRTSAARALSTQRCFARGCIRTLSWAVVDQIEIVICRHLLILHF